MVVNATITGNYTIRIRLEGYISVARSKKNRLASVCEEAGINDDMIIITRGHHAPSEAIEPQVTNQVDNNCKNYDCYAVSTWRSDGLEPTLLLIEWD
jgi:hypothetical protein